MALERWTRPVFLWALLLGAAVLAYANALNHPLMIDDPVVAVIHPDVDRDGGIWTLWGHDYWAGRSVDKNLYRPVTVLSFYLNARLPGVATKNAGGYIVGVAPWALRLVNVALLATAAWLAARWLGRHAGPLAAALAALIYLLHPVHSAIVHPVVARADLLVMCFTLAALVWHRRMIERGAATPMQAIVLGALALGAMLSKETGLIVLPAVLAQQWVAARRSTVAAPEVSPARPGRMSAMAVIAVMSAAAIWLAARSAVVGFRASYEPAGELTDNPLLGLAMTERLPGVGEIAWTYVRQTIWPSAGYWRLPLESPTWSDAAAIAGWVTLLIGAAALLVALRRRHWLAMPLMLAAGQFAIIGNLFVPTAIYAADRVMDPFLLLAASVLAMGMARLLRDEDRRAPLLAGAGVVAAVLVLVNVLVFNPAWASLGSLMEADLRRTPGLPIARYSLLSAKLEEATRLASVNRPAADRLRDEVARELMKLLEAFPENPRLHYQLAVIDAMAGRVDAAATRFKLAIAHDRRKLYTVDALNQWAVIEILSARYTEAEALLRQAYDLAPTDPNVLHNLAVVAVQQRKLEVARQRYEALLRVYPYHAAGLAEYRQLRAALEGR